MENSITNLMKLNNEFASTFGAMLSAESDKVFGNVESENPFELGNVASFIPAVGAVTWQLDSRYLNAYIAELPSGSSIGYLRLPRYQFRSDVVADVKRIIQYFEKRTQVLLFDQTNNPGGDMLMMYEILSMLTTKELELPKHELALTQIDYDRANEVISRLDRAAELGPERMPSPELVAYSRFVKDHFNPAGGKNTPPTYLLGISSITPADIRYTKPVIVLINELTFSAPEFLAAILQDNRQATIFGANSAGAGVCVRKLPGNEIFGIESMTITWTLAVRSNGQYIESTGIKPDISYVISVEDLQAGYAGYKRALIKAVEDKLRESTVVI